MHKLTPAQSAFCYELLGYCKAYAIEPDQGVPSYAIERRFKNANTLKALEDKGIVKWVSDSTFGGKFVLDPATAAHLTTNDLEGQLLARSMYYEQVKAVEDERTRAREARLSPDAFAPRAMDYVNINGHLALVIQPYRETARFGSTVTQLRATVRWMAEVGSGLYGQSMQALCDHITPATTAPKIEMSAYKFEWSFEGYTLSGQLMTTSNTWVFMEQTNAMTFRLNELHTLNKHRNEAMLAFYDLTNELKRIMKWLPLERNDITPHAKSMTMPEQITSDIELGLASGMLHKAIDNQSLIILNPSYEAWLV